MNNNIKQLFMMVIPVFLCSVAPAYDVSIKQEKACSDIYLAGFFPRSSPFSHSRANNRLSEKKLSNKIEALNQNNFLLFQEKVEPVMALIRALETRSDAPQRVLAYWQLGELIHREKQLYSDNTLYHTYLMKALADSCNISYDQLEAIEMLYQKYHMAATLSLQLTWDHYLVLIEIEDDQERSFYQHLAVEKAWTPTELQKAVKRDLFHQKSEMGSLGVTACRHQTQTGVS